MDLKLWCDTCIKFQLFAGAQDVFIRLTAVCCMFLPYNPYRLPQHYKWHVCGPSCSCKVWFCWICLIFEHWFCLNYMGAVCHWKPFWSTATVCFIGHCWYFNSQCTPLQAIIKACGIRTLLVSWKKCAIAVSTYRVSQEECARLWEGVPYVKVCRYNPKHLCPKLSGQRKWGLLVGPHTVPVSWQSYPFPSLSVVSYDGN